MNRAELLRQCLPDTISLNPIGENAGEIWIQEFDAMCRQFFDSVMEIQKADISAFPGYGEMDEYNKPQYNTFMEFIEDSFADDHDDYWKNWRELFKTSLMTEEFFEKYYNKMTGYVKYCENRRFLVNNNLFFGNMVIMKDSIGFLDWDRMAVTDWILDFACMDLHRPYFLIPEKLYGYLQEKGIEAEYFKERFLCMAYYKGLSCLRWHASIDDETSCRTIIQSVSELESRLEKL